MPGITQKVDTQESPALHTCLLKHSSFPTHNIVMMHEFCLKLGPTLHPTNCYRPRICIYSSGVAFKTQNANFYVMLLQSLTIFL